jgi:hypothetical protein
MQGKWRLLIGGMCGMGIGFGLHELLSPSVQIHRRQQLHEKAKAITDEDILNSIKKKS